MTEELQAIFTYNNRKKCFMQKPISTDIDVLRFCEDMWILDFLVYTMLVFDYEIKNAGEIDTKERKNIIDQLKMDHIGWGINE